MIYLGLGSNIDDRLNYLNSAVKAISELNKTNVLKSSSVYKTEPWGIKTQDEFLNLVLEAETTLNPEELLIGLKGIEIALGRKNREKWCKREIDIDVLFYNDIVLKNEYINIPHPEIHRRKFVLVPLCELNPGLIHPVFNITVKELLENTTDNSEVVKL